MNILQRAYDIAYERGEEKERQYGPFQSSMARAAEIATLMTRSEHTPIDREFIAMIAMKLAREAFAHKEDNLLDAIVYIAKWNDYQLSKTKS